MECIALSKIFNGALQVTTQLERKPSAIYREAHTEHTLLLNATETVCSWKQLRLIAILLMFPIIDW